MPVKMIHLAPGTPTEVIEPSPTENQKEDKPASTSNKEDDDDDDDDDVYVDDEWGTIRKAMEAEGKAHMSIKEWMVEWCPPSHIKGKSKEVSKKGEGTAKKVMTAEVSSASADDDSRNNIVSKSVKTIVPRNVKTSERVSTPSGSSVTSSVLTIEDEATKRRIDFWRYRFNTLEKQFKELEEENVDLKRKTSRGGGRTKKVLDPTDRQLLDEAKQGMRDVSRHVKFQKPGWLTFSMRQGTVCQMVIRKISWQPGIKEKDYMNSWYNVLVPHLPGVLQDLKNKMTQKYRGQHESKTVAYDCLVCKLSPNIALFCCAEDYGTPNYISGDDLVDVIKSCGDPADMTNDQLVMFSTFALKYAVHAAPKNDLKMRMNKVLQDAKDDGLGLKHLCHIEMLTTSDIAYAIWQYYNSWEDWKAKIVDPTRRYTCGTKYTVTKESGDGKKKKEGEDMYDMVHKWCREFKRLFAKGEDGDVTDKAYEIREICNTKARELGMLKIDGKLKTKNISSWEEAEIEEAAVYDIMDVDGF